MADVKESAMSTASDCKWVRALDANGNSIRISKEDLASVVGGLLGINNTFLKDRGVVTDNFNKKENGVYNMQITNPSEDAPHDAYLYGTMIVFGYAFVTQIYIPYDKGLMYIRQYYNYSSVWSSWRKTDFSILL